MVTEFNDGAVLLEHGDGVATIRLNRPEKRNALSSAVTGGLVDAVGAVEGTDARCVVVEGEGSAFSAGGDIDAMVERQERDAPPDEAVQRIVQRTGRCVERLATCEFPTVAKLDGPAFGAGANVLLACDIQLASDRARLGFGFRQVGLAVDAGTSYLLPRLVGDNVAKELVFSGELLDAERAHDLGLVNHVYPADEFEERADEFVERIAEGPTVALKASKRLLRHGRTSSLSAAIEQEAAAQAYIFETADHEEGVAAFRERRDPDFRGA